MSKFIMSLGVRDVPLIGEALADIVNNIMSLFYGLYFALVKAIAWVLDMLTQLFFIFSGMTPVSATAAGMSNGEYQEVDIVNFFLTQPSFQKAYLYLCLIALGLIIVFAIGKIIKQDYFDRHGPRSKGPIFRNIALSFIAFICIIPIFYFLIDIAAALALLVMRAMGYKGGGVGSLVFNICWEDNGTTIQTIARVIGDPQYDGYVDLNNDGIKDAWYFLGSAFDQSGIYDPDNFGWYSSDTFYQYYWDTYRVDFINKNELVEFYWYTFIFTGLILIVNLAQMMLAMVTRMYNLIALFIISPSPISQIVLDDGARFKNWKDRVIQEALKVVSCVMSFMLFIMVVSVVNSLDLMRYAFTDKAASAVSLLESNNLTLELSNSINGLYYNGDQPGDFDKALNALGRCMIVLAGVGAIKDIDKIITPFLYGGEAGMTQGEAGKALAAAGGAAAKGALDIGRKGIGLAVSGATSAVSLAAGAGMSALKGLDKGLGTAKQVKDATAGATSSIQMGDAPKLDLADAMKGGENNDASASAPTNADTNTNNANATENAENDAAENVDTNTANAPENAENDAAENVNANNVNEAETAETDAAENVDTNNANAPENAENDAAENANTNNVNDAEAANNGANNNDPVRFNSLHTDNQLGNGAKFAKKVLGIGGGLVAGTLRGATSAALGITGHTLKAGGKLAGTAAKTGLSCAGIMAKTVLQMTGMGGVANAASGFVSGVAADTGKAVGALGKDLKKQGQKFKKSGTGARLAGHAKNAGAAIANTARQIGRRAAGSDGAVGAVARSIQAAGRGLGAAGQYVKESGGITGTITRSIARGIDRYSRTRVHLDPEDKKVLDETAASTTSSVASSVAATNGSEKRDEIRDNAAATVDGVTQQLENAQQIDNVGQAVTGESNRDLVVDDNLIGQIDKAKSDANQYTRDTAQIMGIASNEQGVNSYLDGLGSTHSTRATNVFDDGKLGSGGAAKRKRSDVLRRIAAKNYALREEHSGIIATVAEKGVDKLSTEESKQYGDYLAKARQLDDAYLYAHGGYEDGKESFDRVESSLADVQLTSNSIDEEKLFNGMRERAQHVGQMQSKVTTTKKKQRSDISDLEGQASLATQLKMANNDLSRARANYHDDYSEKEKESVMTASAKVGDLSSRLGAMMVESKDNTVAQSAKNVRLNRGNARMDSTREEMRANIDAMIEAGAPQDQIDAAEAEYEGLTNLSRSEGAANQYQNMHRKKVAVTGTVRMKNAAKRTAAQAASAAAKQAAGTTRKPSATRTPGGDTTEVDTSGVKFVQASPENMTKTHVDAGVGDDALLQMLNAYNAYNGAEKDASSGISFAEKIKLIDPKQIAGDARLASAIGGIKKAPQKGWTAAEYRRDATARYEGAISSYNQSIERAINLSNQYANTRNPELLNQLESAIAEAANASESIRELKIELKIDDKN